MGRYAKAVRTAGMVTGLVLLAALASCAGRVPDIGADRTNSSAPSPSPSPSPYVARDNRPPTVALLYQNIDSTKDLAPLGKVDIVVTVQQQRSGESTAAAAIKAHGSQPFRYFQSYWYPVGREYEGLDIGSHPEWAYCRQGNTPLDGRTQNGVSWRFIDANEKGFIDWLHGRFEELKAAGYDGIMFDRGRAALNGMGEPARVWNKPSTCTDDPVEPGATFADAYVTMMAEAHKAGLELFQNYGDSPFDKNLPFRPDPSDPNCPLKPGCRHLDSGLESVDLFLDEAVAHPRDEFWQDDFDANLAGERDGRLGGKVVGLITQGTLGGDDSRDAVFYQYGRVRLFDMALAIFTGYDRCGGRAAEFCNRLGAYPELAELEWGKPLTAEPVSTHCSNGSPVNCLWVREYENGVIVVNSSDRAIRAEVPLERARCGTARDVFSNTETQLKEPCAKTLTVDVPAWGSRPEFITSNG